MTALARHEQAPPLATQEINPVAAMLQAVTAQGVTPENAAALEKLTDLYIKMDAVNSKRAFNADFAAMQAELPNVAATKAVPNNDGTTRYTYAPFEEIMATVKPILVKHGFGVRFSQEVEEGRLVAVCTLSHRGGHSECNRFAVRIGTGPRGTSEAQADGAASTYAKRYALCNCLNIAIDRDTDARGEGDVSRYITTEQARDLEDRLRGCGREDFSKFLKFAGATSFATIMESKYNELDDWLTKLEQKAGQR